MAMSLCKCYCSVPCCSNNKKTHPYLSFHDFPKDISRCAQWIKAIRRDEGPHFKVQRGSTYVCSMHFESEEIYKSKTGLTLLQKSAVPSKFLWNNWGKQRNKKIMKILRLYDEVHEPEDMTEAAKAVAQDHDYTWRPSPDKLESDEQKIKDLDLHASTLEHKIRELTFQKQQPVISKFCVTDEDFRFYCQVSSKEVFDIFWDSIYPSASRLAYWTEAQNSALETSSPVRKLPLIDELFLFLCRVAAGLHERTLSAMFEVSISTVNRIIVTWTNYLFLVLGSQPTWMTKEQVQNTMPEGLKLYYSHVRVIIGCTEIQCESPSSLAMNSETFSNDKPYTTFKGLIGVSPSGIITFVSKIYTGSISDVQITRKSKLLQLLEPGDAVIADEDFLIEKMLSAVGAELIIPPLERSRQFSLEDSLKTEAIAHMKNLVERAIRRVKAYHIWDGVAPVSVTGSVNQLWAVCCLMSNYQGPLDIQQDMDAAYFDESICLS